MLGKDPLHLLLLVSNIALRSWLKQHLPPHATLTEAASPALAYEIWQKGAVDLVLVDHSRNAVELCRQLKRQPQDSAIPILLICAPQQTIGVGDALEAGCIDFIVQPIDLLELQLRMQKAIEFKVNQSRLHAALSDLKERSEKDPLTHLYNRRVLREYLAREISKAYRTQQSCGLLMIDIDHFKEINDHYGHPAADHILVEFANRLQKNMRHYDLLTRHGGDEFIAMLPAADLATTQRVANKLWKVVGDAPFKSKAAGEIFVTISIGITALDARLAAHKLPPEQCVEQLLTFADQALYQAKQQGRNRIAALSAANPLATPITELSK